MDNEYIDSVDYFAFGSRRFTTTSTLSTSGYDGSSNRDEPCDILALAAAIADVYANPDVLEMEVRINVGEKLSSGKVSQVSTVDAQFIQPSVLDHSDSQNSNKGVAIKRSEKRLFSTVTGEVDQAPLRSFITELRILGFESLRNHPNIVKIIGIHWNCLYSVSTKTQYLVVESVY